MPLAKARDALPADAERHITSEGIEKLYRVTLGLAGRHRPHGWRSAFSTLAREAGFDREVVELALDHAHDDDVATAYDRGERFISRIRLYRSLANQLEGPARRAIWYKRSQSGQSTP